MAEVGGETIEGIAQSAMAMESREKGKIRFPLAQHIGFIADRVMAKRTRQTGQHHMVTPELSPQMNRLLQVFLDVIAVRSEDHKLAVANQITECVGDPLPLQLMGRHPLHGLEVNLVHSFKRRG